MAGDWIKLETATPNKPETYRIAEMLGVTPDDALGKLARFWIWLDHNSCNGSVTHVFAKSLEALMHTPGFVSAMVDVGWLELDEKTGRVTIPNYGRHNGTSAKSRALARDRMKRKRYADVTQISSPEKRREEKRRESQKQSQERGTRLPKDWTLPEDWRDWAVNIHHLEPDRVIRIGLKFRDYWWAKAGRNATHTDWLAVWRNWIRTEVGDA